MARLFAWETELPKPDLEQCKLLQLGPGRVAVEMAAPETTRGGLYIPDKERKNRRPSLAVVIAAGELPAVQVPTEGLPKENWPWAGPDIKPGDIVFVHPQDGKRIHGFGIGTYDAKNEVRLLGIMALYKGHQRRVPWDESILGVWNPMTRTARAVGRRILLELPEKVARTPGGLWVPEDIRARTDVATIRSAGSQVTTFREEGRQVTFERRALHEIHHEDGVVYAFIHEDGIYAYVDEPAQVAA